MKEFDIVRIIIIVFDNKGNREKWFQLHTQKNNKIDKWNKLHDSWWMIGWGVKCSSDYFDEGPFAWQKTSCIFWHCELDTDPC